MPNANSDNIDVSVGLETYFERYKETSDGMPFIQEDAKMLSLTSKVSYITNRQDAISVFGRYSLGKSDYVGTLQNQEFSSLRMNDQKRSSGQIGINYTHYLNLPTTKKSVLRPVYHLVF